ELRLGLDDQRRAAARRQRSLGRTRPRPRHVPHRHRHQPPRRWPARGPRSEDGPCAPAMSPGHLGEPEKGMTSAPLLALSHLSLAYETPRGTLKALDAVSLAVAAGET